MDFIAGVSCSREIFLLPGGSESDDEVFDIVLSIVLSTCFTIDRISMCRYSWLAVAKKKNFSFLQPDFKANETSNAATMQPVIH